MEYPVWICNNCGDKYGRWYSGGTYSGPPNHCATYHYGKCDICNAEEVPVTEPRDFGHLSLEWHVQANGSLNAEHGSKKHRNSRKKSTG